MRLFQITKPYLSNIIKIDRFIPQQEGVIGTIIRLNGYIYFLPILKADDNDYDKNGIVKSPTPFLMRMIDPSTKKCIGKFMFSSMFSVPYKELVPVLMNELDDKLLNLYSKRVEYIKKNKQRIENAAYRLYKQKTRNYSQPYLNTTVNFSIIENYSINYELTNYGKHYNLFPDEKYFITNSNETGITDYYLMNKTTKIAKISFNNETNTVTGILEEIHPDFAPLECFKENKLNLECISAWFKGRGIPSWRDGLYDLLDNLGIENKDTLLNKAFGLSLTDQYWMNPVDKPMDWNDINFFTNDFNSHDFVEACFENKVFKKGAVDLFTPNNTSDGMLKKAWIVDENNKRCLLKGSFKQMDLEPFCEVLASKVAKAIQVQYVDYTIEVINNKPLSKCECFIDQNIELLSAFSILWNHEIDLKKENALDVYNKYVRILEEHGIANVKEKIAKMYVLDYLIVNKDRHLGNYGVIRDVTTLDWIDIAPVFDSGQAMYSQSKTYEYNFHSATGTFFNDKECDFETILNIVLKDVKLQINELELREIANDWKLLLKSYAHLTSMLDEKIDALYDGFLLRIQKLQNRLSKL